MRPNSIAFCLSTIVMFSLEIGLSNSAEAARQRLSGMCVYYVRQLTDFDDIRGDAWAWWHGAAGRYERGNEPAVGSVVVFKRRPFLPRGHVGVVSRVLDDRTILIDHSWFRGRGLMRGMRAVDVSQSNDWSAIRLVYDHVTGTQTYPLSGFIYPRPERRDAGIVVAMAPGDGSASQGSDPRSAQGDIGTSGNGWTKVEGRWKRRPQTRTVAEAIAPTEKPYSIDMVELSATIDGTDSVTPRRRASYAIPNRSVVAVVEAPVRRDRAERKSANRGRAIERSRQAAHRKSAPARDLSVVPRSKPYSSTLLAEQPPSAQ